MATNKEYTTSKAHQWNRLACVMHCATCHCGHGIGNGLHRNVQCIDKLEDLIG